MKKAKIPLIFLLEKQDVSQPAAADELHKGPDTEAHLNVDIGAGFVNNRAISFASMSAIIFT